MGRIQSNRMNLKHPNFLDYAFEKSKDDDSFLIFFQYMFEAGKKDDDENKKFIN